jgi:hypothetical protein
MSRRRRPILSVAVAWFALLPVLVWAGGSLSLDGYAEFIHFPYLVVDGQRVLPAPDVDFHGSGDAADPDSIPLGYEVRVRGERRADGVVVAHELEAKPNGSALFEGDLRQAFDAAEARFRQRGQMYEEGGQGKVQSYGKLYESGPQVERARSIANRLLPPYMGPGDIRVYVVENDEWNAMAAPNGSIYVFSGLLRDMDDDEVAIILGHELAHATHEHARRQFKRGMLISLAAAGVVVGAGEAIDNKTKRALVQVAAVVAASAWKNGYGREHEDQSDRVGLRYAYEGGFDVTKGPGLWQRFADKYGDSSRIVNFFFGDHSVATARRRNLERELAYNYGSATAPASR